MVSPQFETYTQTKSLRVQFNSGSSSLTLPFSSLSDGEKCFFISAIVLAANHAHGPVLCFWDEPDSHLSLDEVGYFIAALRREFEPNKCGQLLVTSHSEESIRRFSDENTFLLYRRTHLEPTQVQLLDNIQYTGDIVGALLRGELQQ